MTATEPTADRKWSHEGLGPRQAKQVNEAFSAFGWEAKTQGEQTDHGTFYSTPLIGGGWANPLARELMDAIQAAHDFKIGPENYKQVIEDLQDAIVKMKACRPVVDKRSTPEERAERQKAAEERKAQENAQAAERTAQRAIWDAMVAKRPAGAEAIIIAQLEEDASDMMSDYFNSRTSRRVAIGWRFGKREDFKQLRAAAAQFPETAHLGPDADKDVEHRDNYSMGHGNWVGDNRYSGWQVRSIDLNYEHCFPGACEDAIPHGLSNLDKSQAIENTDGVTVKRNKQRNGVEIRFAEKPAAAILERLKSAGWRWSRFSKCWYATFTPEAWAFAHQTAGKDAPPVEDVEDAGLKSYTDIDGRMGA